MKRLHTMLATKDYQHFQILSEAGDVLESFEGSAQAERALPGDTVYRSQGKLRIIQRAPVPPLIGTIMIESKFLFGHTSRNIPIYLFFPYDTSYPPMRVGCSSRDGKNKIGIVRFESWAEGETYPRGALQTLLGDTGNHEAEKEALLQHYVPTRKQILKSQQVEMNVSSSHLPLLEGYTFNIDPEGCKDIDDVFTLEKINDTQWKFTITIANLLDVVKDHSELDELAQKQATTFYRDGEAVAPMLPRSISEDLCSLLPGQERRGMSLEMIWDGQTLSGFQFKETRLVNTKTYTYESIQELSSSEFPRNPLEVIASALKGEPTSDSHEWVEQAMVLYNRKVAELFMETHTGLLRRLDELDPTKLEQKAAEYCLPAEDARHAAFGHVFYTHATSPLRRYADLLAQRYLRAVLVARNSDPQQPSLATLKHLNERTRAAARYERDSFFLDCMTAAPVGVVPADVKQWSNRGDTLFKVHLRVPLWNRCVNVRVGGKCLESEEALQIQSKDGSEVFSIEKEKPVLLHYYCDMKQPNWKRRMVFSLKPYSAMSPRENEE